MATARGIWRARRARPAIAAAVTIAAILHAAASVQAVAPPIVDASLSRSHVALLRYPGGIALDTHGNAYVTDSIDNRLQKLSPDGRVLDTWGGPGAGQASFNGPSGLAVDRRGYIYVADTRNHRVQKLARDGRPVAQWSRTQSHLLFEPGDVALDGRGKLYVADGENAWIEVLSSSGKTLERLGSFENPSTGQFAGPAAVAVDSAGFVYVADYTWITKLSSRGIPIATWGRFGRQNSRFELPNGLAVDSRRNVYVSDALTNRIVKLSSDGKTLRRWGSAGHAPGQFEGPTDVAVDSHDNVYVTDFGNHRVEKFSSSGRLLAIWK